MGIKLLKYLSIRGNQMERITADAFSHLNGLQKLDISHNRIRVLSPGILQDSQVREIDISHNVLPHINIRTLDVPSLGKVVLSLTNQKQAKYFQNYRN